MGDRPKRVDSARCVIEELPLPEQRYGCACGGVDNY